MNKVNNFVLPSGGGLNACVGHDQISLLHPDSIWCHGMGKCNADELLVLQFC